MRAAPFERHGDLFVLTNRIGGHDMKAVCEMWGHANEWEVRLQIVGKGMVAFAAVPTVPLAMETGERWKAAMIALGWYPLDLPTG